MTRFLPIFLLLLTPLLTRGQNFTLKIEGSTETETRTIDSISYNKVHKNAKSADDEANAFSEKLMQEGYLENHIVSHLKTNDSTFLYTFSIGAKTNTLYIYTGKLTEKEKEVLAIDKDTITLSLAQAQEFMTGKLALLERKGYSMSSLRLGSYDSANKKLYATLFIKSDKKRTIDGIVTEGYTKFPEGIRHNLQRQYRRKTFNQDNLQRVYEDFNGLQFVSQVRYPEILFKEDSTKIYVYLEKAKPNTFDGFIGFSNSENENKLKFNGYLNLLLNNILNSGEKFNLNWKNNGDGQTTFNIGFEVPYIFKSPIGIKASLTIFKQDSIYQNTVTDLNAGYYFSYNSKLFIGYQQTQSVDIQNTNDSSISDYSNAFWTSTYQYTQYNREDMLFPEKTSAYIKGGIGHRNAKTGNSNQYFVQLNLSHNLYLNRRNIIYLKNESYYLKSDNYIINELYRFGGINSIRGFNENSLQASIYGGLMAEYRYVLAPNMYIHTITDYGYFEDKSSGIKDNLLGLGFGFGLLTKTGLFNIVYANGSTKGQTIKLSNSIVHLSFKTTF